MGQILQISLKLNFTPNNLGCYGLKTTCCFRFDFIQSLYRPKNRYYLDQYIHSEIALVDSEIAGAMQEDRKISCFPVANIFGQIFGSTPRFKYHH